MAGDSQWLVLCDASEVLPDFPLRVEVNNFEYAVFNLNGHFYVTQEHCTHGPGMLSEGVVLDEEIECPFHQGRFLITTGEPTFPPCTEPLRVWTVHLIDGKICIDPSEERRAPV